MDRFAAYVSELVFTELGDHPDPKQREQLLSLARGFRILLGMADCDLLAQQYLNEKLLPIEEWDDAFHLAIASVHQIQFLVSWNFKHLVNTKTRRQASLINLREGYSPIEIVAPPEI